jgi:prepilin peptidase CpaA
MRPVFAGSAFGLLAGTAFTILIVMACVSDLRTRRIPNQLAAVLAVLGLAYSTGVNPFPSGFLQGVGGLVAGLLIWVPFWLLGWLGAGDVMLFAGASAWLGTWGAVQAAGLGALVGAVLAVMWLGWERGVRVAVEKSLIAMIHPKVLASPSVTTHDRRRLVPYGVALATGLLVAAWFPWLLFL